MRGILPASSLELQMPHLFRNLYYDVFQSEEAWILADGTKQLLEHLDCYRHVETAGVTVGILSNSDNRTLDILKSKSIQTSDHPSISRSSGCKVLGISSHFDFVLTSYEVKTEKPSPEIFKQAMHFAGVSDPCLCVHVGDSLESDVRGALQLSWRAIHVCERAAVHHNASIEVAKTMNDVKLILNL
jgi:phosphoglycolate phosphatase-like HAD superfamily hydrolase